MVLTWLKHGSTWLNPQKQITISKVVNIVFLTSRHARELLGPLGPLGPAPLRRHDFNDPQGGGLFASRPGDESLTPTAEEDFFWYAAW